MIRQVTVEQHEKTGNVALVLFALMPFDDIRCYSLRSTVSAAGTCAATIVVDVKDEAAFEEFKRRFMHVVARLDTAEDVGAFNARMLALPSQRVLVRVLMRDTAEARQQLLTIASKQALRHGVRMRDFEANVERWTDEPEEDPLVVEMDLVVEERIRKDKTIDRTEALSFAHFSCDLQSWYRASGFHMSMHRYGQGIYVSEEDFSVTDVLEWLETSEEERWSSLQSPVEPLRNYLRTPNRHARRYQSRMHAIMIRPR